MEPTFAANQPTLPDPTPQEAIRAFRASYTWEQVQEELWCFAQPRLLESFRDMNPDTTNKLAAFYENIEILISAVYQLPDLTAPPTAGETTAVNPDPAGGTGPGEAPLPWPAPAPLLTRPCITGGDSSAICKP